MKTLRHFCLSLMLSLLIVAPSAWGGKGTVSTQLGPNKDNAYAVVVQPDGKIIAVGASYNGKDSDIAVARYRTDGALDLTFGDGGVAIFDSKLGDDKAYAAVLQADGKLVVAGTVFNGKNQTFAVLRFLNDGTLDPNFGRNGVSNTDFGKGDSAAYSLAIQPDGKIVVAGYASNGKDLDFAVEELSANGVLDFSFGHNGQVLTGLGDGNNRGGDEHAYSVLIQPDGRILVAGYSEVGDSSVFATLRYLPNGLLDRSFGVEGSAVTQIGKYDKAYAAYLQNNGDILVAGSTQQSDSTVRFALVRYLPNGVPDPEFGDKGIVTTLFGKGKDTIYALDVQSDGKILAAGSYFDGGDTDLALARYLPNGALDDSFAQGGKAAAKIDWKYSTAYGLALQPDGRIVAAGTSSGGKGYHVAVARYLGDGNLDESFGGGMLQLAGNASRTPITAELGLPKFLLKSFLEKPEP